MAGLAGVSGRATPPAAGDSKVRPYRSDAALGAVLATCAGDDSVSRRDTVITSVAGVRYTSRDVDTNDVFVRQHPSA